MVKRYCDKCGKEINAYPYQGMNTLLPMYKVMYIQGINLNCEIDLCIDCNSNLGKWLKGENKEK